MCVFVCVSQQEGKQASLAADFSITQFKHIGRLLMVHGRNSYKRSAALGQFVMHRGMIISTMQVQTWRATWPATGTLFSSSLNKKKEFFFVFPLSLLCLFSCLLSICGLVLFKVCCFAVTPETLCHVFNQLNYLFFFSLSP